MGRTYSANQLALEIFSSVEVVDDFFSEGIEEKCVHREVATLDIVPGIGETHPGGMTTIHIVRFLPESRHLEIVGVLHHHDHPELFAHGDRLGEQLLNFLWGS